MILAIDPGKEKHGLAVLDNAGKTQTRKIVWGTAVFTQILDLIACYHPCTLVIGQSAFGKSLVKELEKYGIKTPIVFISEKNSTQLARKRYWEENPPRGLWKLIPTGLRTPPIPIDDLAAVILGERYLKS
jgi:RNase H-fold protein (predicted Holliday junction resolvase)